MKIMGRVNNIIFLKSGPSVRSTVVLLEELACALVGERVITVSFYTCFYAIQAVFIKKRKIFPPVAPTLSQIDILHIYNTFVK